LGQYDQAITYYQQALAIKRELEDREGEEDTLQRLGRTYNSLNQYDQAIRHYELALAVARELEDRERAGTLLDNLGEAYASLSQYEQAIQHYEKALAIQLEQKNPEAEGAILHKLMLAWKDLQKLPLSIFYGKQAVRLYQELRSQKPGIGDQDLLTSDSGLLVSNSYRSLADLLISMGRISEAQQIMGLLKREEYFDFAGREVEEMGSLAVQDELTPVEEMWEKRYWESASRVVVLGTERSALLAKQTRTPEEENRLRELELDIQEAELGFQKFLRELSNELGSSKKAAGEVRESPVLEVSPSLQKNLRNLGSGLVALYTLVGEEKYQVVLVTPDLYKVREYPIQATDLSRKVLVFRQVLQNPRFDPLPLAQELYRILVGPIAQDLKDTAAGVPDHAPLLMWSLDGALRYLPMGVLHDGEKYLIERYP
ncbi:MAG: tetratricopeptide repeat protein, partial [Nitrospira sp.]|nr:tetratricopeptide repeat protein [Nitrospira sp.]